MKETRGGKRPGSGRKKGIETVSIAFRVPVDCVDEIKDLFKEWKLKHGKADKATDPKV